MISNDKLRELITEGESERVEFKPSGSQGSSIRKAICAFANDLAEHSEPGFILVGVTSDGQCAGLEVNDDLHRRLSEWARGGDILPIPDVAVYTKDTDNCQLVVVEVHPSDEPPVRYRGQIWVRIASTNRTATPEQEKRLSERRRAHDLPFDQRPADGATLDDLDLRFFEDEYLPNAIAPEVLEENHRTVEQKLKSLRFLTQDTPNHGAVNVLGIDPRGWIPGAYLVFLRVDGTELGDPIKDEKTLSGRLPDIMAQLDGLLELHIQVSVDIESADREVQVPDYPYVALQQLARNALIHRAYEGTSAPVRVYWFSDRVEISNPGGLYGQVTQDNFGEGATDYRNPLIAEAMGVLGYVQRFGYGIPVAKRQLRVNGNPPPEFEFTPTYTSVTVRA
jgi:ATP-dependent DNA helicase RecG